MGNKEQDTKCGRCALCGNFAQLKESHIIPKFVSKELKRCGTNRLRNTNNPNEVVQDAEKLRLLCEDCEELFSSYETKFSNDIFHPYRRYGRDVFFYNRNLARYMISIAWRRIYLEYFFNNVEYPDKRIVEAEWIMREYLLKKRNDLGAIENHIFFCGNIIYAADELKSIGPNQAIKLSAGGRVSETNDGTLYVATNILGVLLVTVISRINNKSTHITTEVVDGEGELHSTDQFAENLVAEEIEHIILIAGHAGSEMNSDQRNKAVQRLIDNNYFEDTGYYKELMNDIDLIK